MRANKILSIGLLLAVLFLMIGTASAQYRIFGTEIQATGEGDITMEDIYLAINNDTYIEKVDANTYHIKTLRLRIAATGTPTTLYIVNETIRIDSAISPAGGTFALYSYEEASPATFYIENSTIGTWDNGTGDWVSYQYKAATSAPNTNHETSSMHCSRVGNSTFIAMKNPIIKMMNGGFFVGNTIIGSTNGFQLIDGTTSAAAVGDNLTIRDLYAEGMVLNGMRFTGIRNSIIDNITINNSIDNKWYEATGGDGISVADGTNNSFSNIVINYPSYSGLRVSGTESFSTFQNVTLETPAHVGYDLRASNITFQNLYVNGSKTNSMAFVGAHYNTLTNVTLSNSGANSAYVADTQSSHITMRDMVISGTNAWGMRFLDGDSYFKTYNVTLLNPPTYGYTLQTATANMTLFDTDLSSAITEQIEFTAAGHTGTVFINVNGTVSDSYSNTYYRGYYPNILVTNLQGQAVENALITFNQSVLNADADWQAEFYTDQNGRLTVDNRTNLPALDSFRVYSITAAKGTETDVRDGIQSDATWYSADLSDLQGTEIVLVLDVGGSGEAEFIITEYSPLDTTPTITVGQSQQFSATTNAAGTFVWTLDGAIVRTTNSVTTDSYTASGLAAGEYTVLLTVTSGEDSVTQTWTLTVEEEPVTPPVESRDRMSGPETAIALIGVLLVVLVATAILGSLAGLITGVIDMQQTAATVGVMVLVAVLAFVGLAVLSGITGALNI